MKILIVEPFFSDSHKKWAEEYQQFSRHEIKIISLPGRHWKWRMFGGAVSLARMFLESDFQAQVLIASDMLDLSTFVSLCKERLNNTKIALYFHENQITYPWSPVDKDIRLQRNNQYGFINYTSALVADKVFYNSQYHLNSFINSLSDFLKQFPDHRNLENIDKIKAKSEVLYLGLNLKKFDHFLSQSTLNQPVILWNHRWEYDKNPDLFFKTLHRLKAENIAFKLICLGKCYSNRPDIFNDIESHFSEELIHFGYATTFNEYAEHLSISTILPVTSNQDFFGGSVVEAIYCQCFPILPKRLAYPEHIPDQFHDNHFYNDDDEFYEILKKTVLTFEVSKFDDSLKNFVARYDWSNLAPVYDDSFENLFFNS